MYLNAGLIEESIVLNEKIIHNHPHIIAPYITLGTIFAEQKNYLKVLSLISLP